MPGRAGKVLRLLTIAVFAAVAVLAFRVLTPEDAATDAEPRSGELDVQHAINGPYAPVTVRGYVFLGPGGMGLRLCQARRNSSPPACIGPFVDLDGVNEGSFAFESGKTDDGEVRWVEDPIALRGTLEGTRMRVTEVLR